MTQLEIVRTLYSTGVVLQWGHKTHGFYPLRFIGRFIIRRANRKARLIRQRREEKAMEWGLIAWFGLLGFMFAGVIFYATVIELAKILKGK